MSGERGGFSATSVKSDRLPIHRSVQAERRRPRERPPFNANVEFFGRRGTGSERLRATARSIERLPGLIGEGEVGWK